MDLNPASHPALDIDAVIADHGRALSEKLQAHRLELFPPAAEKTLRPFPASEVAKLLGIKSGYLRNLALDGKGPEPLVEPRRPALLHRRTSPRIAPLSRRDRARQPALRPPPPRRRTAPDHRRRQLQGRQRQDHDRRPSRPAPHPDRPSRARHRPRPAGQPLRPARPAAGVRRRRQRNPLRRPPLRQPAAAAARDHPQDQLPRPPYRPRQHRADGVRIRHPSHPSDAG